MGKLYVNRNRIQSHLFLAAVVVAKWENCTLRRDRYPSTSENCTLSRTLLANLLGQGAQLLQVRFDLPVPLVVTREQDMIPVQRREMRQSPQNAARAAIQTVG